MKSPHELQELILHVAPKIWEQYKDLFSDKIGQLPPISFVSKKSNSLGFAYYSGKVEFNLAYLCFIPWEQTKETVAHELAHIVQFRVFPNAKQAHGPEFRLIMQLAGYSGETKAKGIRKNTKAHAELVSGYLLDL